MKIPSKISFTIIVKWLANKCQNVYYKNQNYISPLNLEGYRVWLLIEIRLKGVGTYYFVINKIIVAYHTF